MLRCDVLGPVQVWAGDDRVALAGARQQAVLLALALRPGVTVGKRELIDGVWGPELPPGGDPDVAGYVYRLRKVLGSSGVDRHIVTDGAGYRFAGELRVDTARLEEMAGEAVRLRQAGELASAATAASRALELYRGEPLAGLPGPYADGQRQRLTERRMALWQEKYECMLRLGRHDQVAGELSELTAAQPCSERLAALLIRAFYAGGWKADALSAYERTRDRLSREMGAGPGKELLRLYEAVCRDDDLAAGFGPGRRPAAAAPRQLPADVRELVGRDRELARLTAARARVVAVSGMAGVGKTALVVRAAWRMVDRYPDGCLFINLRGHARGLEPQRALRQLLRGLDGQWEETEDLDDLIAAWRSATADRRLLVVLDDAASATQVRPLLPAGPESRALVTSRRLLGGLDVDDRVTLRPLTLDDATRLLAGIAGAERAGGERGAVREVARLCGRLPLALRIAGARLQTRPWTPRQLADRLADDDRRLVELTTEDRSVQTSFRLSYDQLPAATREAFRVLGVSPTTEADPLALAAMLDCSPARAEQLLESLVETSLLQQPAAGRYRMHDLVAAYARQLAAEEPTPASKALAGVLRLYVSAARQASDRGRASFPAEPVFSDRDEAVAWLDAASGEIVDVVAGAAGAGLADQACQLAEELASYLTRRGRYQEFYQVVGAALPLADGPAASSLRIALGDVLSMQGHFDRAQVILREALETSRRTDDLRDQARARRGLGEAEMYLGQFASATVHLAEVVRLATRLDDDWLAASATYQLGVVHHRSRDLPAAMDYFRSAAPLVDKVADHWLSGSLACHLGDLLVELGQCAEAAAMLRDAVVRAEETGDFQLRAFLLTRLGSAEELLGNLDAATALHERALSAVTDQTSVELEFETRVRLGSVHLAADRRTAARQQFERVLALTGAGRWHERRARTLAIEGLRQLGRR
ncbi:AfsR/SARP family transcriptional regulator [Fodinicola acaciae]|uniref:AfsR/SARP family transcriptional regulator n=1 Tax=Fodinicola acaciae TaxID=2681555 RepID=UPI0013D2ED95|nr:BTAD domain-containing putative transcriptional regulator [Fodinicola acaciae]